ncbi:EF-P lysine aminoacylase EpmA [Gammaproteobacteria bacterium]|nr:EF-P lysine aminoacylase EpmA [Gammaproteobacteria bacterium]
MSRKANLGEDWRPGADLATLQNRAALKMTLRDFFGVRGVLEIDTPALSRFANTDPHLDSVATAHGWLHTSPEFAMKRLLAAGCGDIWQLCPVWRADERGRRHNPEFLMLEWYRQDFTLRQLMEEVDALLRSALPTQRLAAMRVRSYREVFDAMLSIDPFTATCQQLADCAARATVRADSSTMTRNDWLDLLMATCIEPRLGSDGPDFITDYPADQAALAQVRQVGDVQVGERFECYLGGIELANGYHELGDPDEQQRRFAADNVQRLALGKPEMPVDTFLLRALKAGMPDCCGVALGFDRLLMIKCGLDALDATQTFSVDRI